MATDARMPRDGRFLEKLGTYNPLLAKDSEERVKMNMDRVKHWLGLGAQPTDRVARMLEAAGVLTKKTRSNPQSAVPGKRMADLAAKKAARAAAPPPAPTPAPAPAAEPVVEPAAEPAVEVAVEVATQSTSE